MKNHIKAFTIITVTGFIFISIFFVGCKTQTGKTGIFQKGEVSDENDAYDGPDKAAAFEFMRTKDPALGYVPTERLLLAKEFTMESKATFQRTMSGYGSWVERGPESDVAGPYGNPRDMGNTASTSGRIRATLNDAADPTGKTVYVAGIDGGIWKTTDITASPAVWVPLSDFITNLAVSYFAQDPTNANTIYASTGESYSNIDAVRGVGVFKSTDHGGTWTLLPATTTFTRATKMVCDIYGNIYLGTRTTGLLRSNDGGANWTNITPSGMVADICDLEISSTGRLHVVSGIFSTQTYRYTDIPATVASAGFTAPATPFPSYSMRAEIAVSGSVLYALPADNSRQVPTIYKSTDGGANWSSTVSQPGGGTWASSQGWYALSVEINPADVNQVIVGGLDNYKTTDGGTTWTKISQWYGSGAPYVHADNHKITWYDGGNKLIISNDGGIFYSTDGGRSFIDKNKGLRIKQFYSVAAHPTNLNYFLAGAQDNGTHQFNNAGLSSTIEVNGGDGAFTAIDQNEPAYQFSAYVYNVYNRSSDNGVNWGSVRFYTGSTTSSNFGQFINPYSYDNIGNIIYASAQAGNFFRWTDPQTLGSASYFFTGTPAWPATASEVTLGALNGSNVLAVTVSPYTANRVYFGTQGGRVCYADAANTIATGSTGVNISTGLPPASVSCIAIGTNDNNLMVSYSNYGVNSIWVSTNNGTAWTSVEGNLPDMPVRWCMFAPGDNSKAIIATETGVWFTQALNGSSTVWTSSPGFPAVRTDMLAYRSLDGTIAAATHGRGLWTQTAASILPLNNFTLRGRWTGNTAELNWSNESLPSGSTFEIESSIDAISYTKIGTVSKSIISTYSYKYIPPTSQNIFYRIKGTEQTGTVKYSNIVRLSKNNNNNNGLVEITKLYPNPVNDLVSIGFTIPEKGMATYTITSLTGQTIWSRQENLTFSGNYNITEYAAALKPGTYVFSILLNGQKSARAFIKK